MTKPSSTSDWDLLMQARTTTSPGSAAAARQLVGRLSPKGYALAVRLCVRSELAEEALQEAFVRLWRSSLHDTGQAELSTVFHRLVANESIRIMGHSSQRELATEDPTDALDAQDGQSSQAELHGLVATNIAHAADPLEAALARCSANDMQKALAQLPGRQRQALVLWAQADQSPADIAVGMGIEPNAVSQLLFRARQRLAKLLAQSPTHRGHHDQDIHPVA